MSFKNLMILLGGLTLVGCGGNLCDRLADDAEACGTEVSDEDKAQCEEDISACSSDDQKLLEDFFDCMAELPGMGECGEATATSTEDLQAMTEAMMACSTNAAGLSAECSASFMGGGGTTTTTP